MIAKSKRISYANFKTFYKYVKKNHPYKNGFAMYPAQIYFVINKFFGKSAINIPYGLLMKLTNVVNYYAYSGKISKWLRFFDFLRGCTYLNKVFK